MTKFDLSDRASVDRALERLKKAILSAERDGTTAVLVLQLRVVNGRVEDVKFTTRDEEV